MPTEQSNDDAIQNLYSADESETKQEMVDFVAELMSAPIESRVHSVKQAGGF